MSERLETLKKARERMTEDRDVHAKALIDALDRAISGELGVAGKG